LANGCPVASAGGARRLRTMTAKFGESVLILASHPDDEIVACGAAAGRARAAGTQVWVIYLTHGCLDHGTVWPWDRPHHAEKVRRRRAEAARASKALGLRPAAWCSRPARWLWRDLPAAEREVRAAIAAHEIDRLWTPAFEGGHPDHDATNALASLFVCEGLSVLEFAEYNLASGRPRSHLFPATTGAEQVITLTPVERAFKRRALGFYASERGNLRRIGVDREVFRPLPNHDYGRPPHPDKLWYSRFHWVPFRHPRVDFVRPQSVYDEIAEYIDRARGPPFWSA